MTPRATGKCTNVNGGRILERMFWLQDMEFNLLCLAQVYGSGGHTEHPNPNYCHSVVSTCFHKTENSLQFTGSPQFFVRKIAPPVLNLHCLEILCVKPKSFLLHLQLRSMYLKCLLACLLFSLLFTSSPILRGKSRVEGKVWPCAQPKGADHMGKALELPHTLSLTLISLGLTPSQLEYS